MISTKNWRSVWPPLPRAVQINPLTVLANRPFDCDACGGVFNGVKISVSSGSYMVPALSMARTATEKNQVATVLAGTLRMHSSNP